MTRTYSLAPASPEFVRAYRMAADFLATHGCFGNDEGLTNAAENAIGKSIRGGDWEAVLRRLHERLDEHGRDVFEKAEDDLGLAYTRAAEMGYVFGLLVGTMVSLPAIQRIPIWKVDDGIDTARAIYTTTEYNLKPDEESTGGQS